MTRVWSIIWLGIWAIWPVDLGLADEPAKKFLDKLRENDYSDIALDYLDSMESSPLASDEFKARIKFEKAETLLSAAAGTRDITQIQQNLDRADQFLKEFAQSNPDPKLLAESERVRARTLFGRGNLANIQAQSEKLTVDEKKELQDQARQFFNESLKVFDQSLESQKVVVKNFKVDSSDPSSIERRDGLWREYVETRFMAPAIKEQIADTYSDTDPERKKLLTQAAAEYADIAGDYARFSRGSYARIAAGRCHKKLGQYEEALTPLIEVLADNVPRSFKLDAAILAIECWEKSKPPGYKNICGRIGEMEDVLNLRDIRDSKVAAVQLGYAKACRNYAEELSNSPKKDSFTKEIADLRRDAAKFAGNVARGSNPLRDSAKQLIAEWNLSTAEAPAPVGKPTNFAEARAQAVVLIEAVEQLRQDAQDLVSRAAAANGADKQTLETELGQKREQLKANAQQALDLLNLAIQMATSEVSREEINIMRMRQAVAHFFLENYYEAFVIGEHLLDRYPNVTGSREAAGVAMRALLQLYFKTPEAERSFERSHLESICDRIIQKWPDEPGTDEAANIMITLALQNSDLTQARKLLETMEAGSPARAKLETYMGRMTWNQYLTQSQKPDSDKAANEALLKQAEQLLASGTANLKPDGLTLDSALGVLNFVQLLLERGEIDQAISQLESSPLGPLDVIKQKLPPAEDLKFVRETYRTALRAYVSGMRSGQQASGLIDKAHNIVVALRETSNGDAAGKSDSLVAMYYQLARELLTQLDRIDQPDEKAAFAESFVTFMKSIQEQSSDAKTLMWVGTTLNSVADKLQASNLKNNAREFQVQALAALTAASAAGFQGDPNAETLQVELKRQLALAHRGQGQFDEATKLFVELLTAKPTLLNVQTDAALTLQMQGDAKSDANFYAQAVGGANKETLPNATRPTNVIWGWRQIAKATQSKEQFANAYFEAVYHMAYCRLRYGELTQRNDAKESALADIKNQSQLYPELGGPQWKPKFVELAKQIQKSLGQPVTGLE